MSHRKVRINRSPLKTLLPPNVLSLPFSVLRLSSIVSVFPFQNTSSYSSFKYSKEIDRLDVEEIFYCFVDRQDERKEEQEGEESVMERVDVAKYFGVSKNQMKDLARSEKKILIKEDRRRRR